MPLDSVTPAVMDAAARRRRMHRRRANRRAGRVATIAGMLFLTAMLLTPEPATRTATLAVASDRTADLEVPTFWRPAGEVLKRKATTSTASLFTTDAQETARREALQRHNRVFEYARRYRISRELAGKVYDAAVQEGIEPELGFRLVRVESVFKPDAISPVGAIGLTQLMLGTARAFEPGVTREQLLDPDVNLRIGFRYLRALIREQKGNLRLALLVYNRGPVAVQNALAMGLDPANGYEHVMLRGYRGRGVLD